MGQEILVSEIQDGTSELTINVVDIPAGIYTVKLKATASSWVSRIIKF